VSLYVTDTHALIWYAQGRFRKLGGEARQIYENADRRALAIYVPALVLTELLEAVHRGALQLNQPARQWVRALFSTGSFIPADLDTDVVLAAENLNAIPELGDRLIAATAQVLGVPLITRAATVVAATGIDVVW
jgi:PIN domain nuclease of toxin-antitoxin system